MRKGFTLIELLITMVLVAVLATVALTKYVSTLERGRAAQVLSILKDVSDAWNAEYVLNGNKYPPLAVEEGEEGQYVSGTKWNRDTIPTQYFDILSAATFSNSQELTVTAGRKGSHDYKLIAVNISGEFSYFRCTDHQNGKDCAEAGFTVFDEEIDGYTLPD